MVVCWSKGTMGPHMGLEDPNVFLELSEFPGPTGMLGKGSREWLIKSRISEYLSKSNPPEERRNDFSNRESCLPDAIEFFWVKEKGI